MVLMIYNTLTREKEELKAVRGNRLNIYVCGPTVYDHCHVGHGRSYVSFDVIRRYLKYKGYQVTYVSNITDIDDKLINRARETGRTVEDLAKEFTLSYLEDMKALNVVPADHYPRATEFVPQMIGLVKELIDKGFAYQGGPDVYFEIEKAIDKVGILSHQKLDQMLPGARCDVGEQKRNPLDFTLWKGSKPGEPTWDSPWGSGRPGWHLECTVMSRHFFGNDLDIHGGGMDLIFPHHESEIIQGECATGHVPFARYWLHNGFLTINNEKMSKSLGNFFTIKEILAKFPARVLRFYVLNTHYRRPVDFSDAHLQEAQDALERLTTTIDTLETALKICRETGIQTNSGDATLRKEITQLKTDFEKAMDDDFNTRDAIAAIYPFTRQLNSISASIISGKVFDVPECGGIVLQEAFDILMDIDKVLGVLGRVSGTGSGTATTGPADAEVKALMDQRDEARARKDWKKADEIRDRLKTMGVEMQDGKGGTRWKRVR